MRKALVSGIEELRRGAATAPSRTIPALLVASDPAERLKVGKTTLRRLIEESALRVEDRR
jgi:hypothetical protein